MELPEMTIETAIYNVDEICRAYKGDRDAHLLLIKSIEVIKSKTLENEKGKKDE